MMIVLIVFMLQLSHIIMLITIVNKLYFTSYSLG